MDFLKNKLFIVLVIAVLLVLISIWYKHPKAEFEPSKLKAWITNGYVQQFCNVIYPKVANCVTLQEVQCVQVATEQITACLDLMKDQLSDVSSQLDAKEAFDANQHCFADNMHRVLVDKYIVNTPECHQKLS